MRSYRVDDIDRFRQADSPYWARVGRTPVTLMPTPLAMQPTAYIRNAWADRQYGQAPKLEVASVHDGSSWALRATWQGSAPGPSSFPDALAVALPVRNSPVLALMGAEDAPIHYLRWSADKQGLLSLLATGIGLSAPGPELKRAAHSVTDGSTRHVVLTRALGGGGNVAPLLAGATTGIGFAVWQGANDERAGIKAFSVDWMELALDI